jgi:hypothetical protein
MIRYINTFLYNQWESQSIKIIHNKFSAQFFSDLISLYSNLNYDWLEWRVSENYHVRIFQNIIIFMVAAVRISNPPGFFVYTENVSADNMKCKKFQCCMHEAWELCFP